MMMTMMMMMMMMMMMIMTIYLFLKLFKIVSGIENTEAYLPGFATKLTLQKYFHLYNPYYWLNKK